jgi:peptidoglycan/xylan/chitin deacetylase (PgdA/CDA1 family)
MPTRGQSPADQHRDEEAPGSADLPICLSLRAFEDGWASDPDRTTRTAGRLLVTTPPSIVTLNVHGVGTPVRDLEPGEDDVWVSVRQFEEVLDAVAGRPDVRLTFDDANASDLDIALPRLRRRGLTAQFFLCAGLLGKPGRLTRDGVRELVDAGMTLGSHGWTHRDWRRLAPAEVPQELAQAPDVLAEFTGQPITEVSVPFGSYDRHVLRRLRAAGVTRAYTSDGGRARPGSWLQARTSLRRTSDAKWLAEVLDGRPSLPRRARNLAARSVKRIRG